MTPTEGASNAAPATIAEAIAAARGVEHVPVTHEHCVHVAGPFFHGTSAVFAVGDELVPGHGSNLDDPNVTDKKFPGNVTHSYRTRHPVRIVGEVETWDPHPPDVLQGMLDGIARLRADGLDVIDD